MSTCIDTLKTLSGLSPCRVSDREAALDAALKLLQQFYLDLEKFLGWLTEAETTCNVLIDATNKEQPAGKNLLAQWKVGPRKKNVAKLFEFCTRRIRYKQSRVGVLCLCVCVCLSRFCTCICANCSFRPLK